MATATRTLTTQIVIHFPWCKKCGICISFCPTKVFTADAFGKPLLSAADKCVECGLCVLLCPEYAIRLKPLEKAPGGEDAEPLAAPEHVETKSA
jgi:2-oxoglutarate ferredoxin oxidoreductase subunit delta